ncbi:MAG TPA: serine/threonine-protein kinase [Streptosporangiaceae bacterium]|nr:serine/threonine-protein kinase [Streptosporangiaceae bacterium]
MNDEVDGDVAGFRTGVGVGSRIAGYRLEGQIGRGGMAEVFLARDERLGRMVALKVLAPALGMDQGFRQRFIRESRAAAAVDDPHIVPVYEAGEADGVLFIAMRYVPGGDARTLVHREGPMPPWRAAAIISPVASALDAAHAAGLLHRDVKPANMLVDVVRGRPDHVYLSDFGLSKAAVSSSGLTRKGEFLGTPDYVSPEQIAGQPADGRADEYALACSAFELLTGAPPFRRDEAVAVMYAQLSAPPPRLTALRPDLPPAADGVLAKALAKTPGERYTSCREFADALRTALGLQPYDTGPGPVGPDRLPTQTAWPDAGGWAQQAGPAVAATQPPNYANTPGGAAATPVMQPGAGFGQPGAGYGQPGAGFGQPGGYPGGGPATPVMQPGAGFGQPGGYAGGGGATPVMQPGGYAGGGAATPVMQPGGGFGQPGGYVPGGGFPGPRRRGRGRTVAVALGTAAVLVVGAVVAVVVATGHHTVVHHPRPPSPALVATISASSALAPVTGDVYVVYLGGTNSSATLSGTVKDTGSGEVARLYALRFPFGGTPAQAGSVALQPTAGTASYSFQVTPSLATRYKVEVFASATATSPVATSATTTVYVAPSATNSGTPTCGRPVCHESITIRVFVPASVLSAEIAKQWYPYFAINLAPAIEPAAPSVMSLGAGNGQVSAAQRVSSTEYDITVTFSFDIGSDAYHWRWRTCDKATEAQDGMGLPGNHGCGAPTATAGQRYLG